MKNIIVLPDGTRISSGADADRSIKSCTTTECVNSAAELTLGSACCSCLEAQILTKGVKLGLNAGDLIKLYKADDQGNEVKVGTFRLDAPSKKSDNIYKITAYDRVADLDKDLSSWLKSLTGWPYKLSVFAEMVCDACDLLYVPADILNAEFLVQEFYKSGVTGRQLMQWVGEIAGRFCRATADGDITFDWYKPSGVTVQPTGGRYYFGGALTYDDYEVAPIDAVQLRLADGEGGALWPAEIYGTVTATSLRIRKGAGIGYDEVSQLAQGAQVKILETKTVDGATWGRIDRGWICITDYVTLKTVAADNPYVITGNAILLARVTDDPRPYLKNIQSQLAALPAYKPCKVSLPAGMDIRAGQTVQVVDKHGNAFTTLVMTKTQAGQRDTLECTGSARRDSSSAVNNKSAAQIAGEAVDNQSWESLFNKWTNGGNIQGIFATDGVWGINAAIAKITNLIADMITAGVLKSDDEKTYFDLDNGVFRSIGDSTITEIGNGNIQVLSLDEKPIFKILGENNGAHLILYDQNAYPSFEIKVYDKKTWMSCWDYDSQSVLGNHVGFKEINGNSVLVRGYYA